MFYTFISINYVKSQAHDISQENDMTYDKKYGRFLPCSYQERYINFLWLLLFRTHPSK